MKKIGLILITVFLFSFTFPSQLFDYKILRVLNENKIYGNSTRNIEPILSEVLSLTTKELSFNLKSKTDLVFKTKVGNCVGYTKYYNKLLSEKLKKENIGNITISHARAKVLVVGQNIHFSNSPSLKDHDISIVKNNNTGEVYYIDPSLSEVFGNIIVKQ
jgi:hypothetical protein